MYIRRTEDIGALVRQCRRQLGLSQIQLAHKLGVSQSYLSHLEKGKKTLQLGLVLRVLNELGVVLSVEKESELDTPRGRKISPISIDEIVDG